MHRRVQGTKPWLGLGFAISVPFEVSEKMKSVGGAKWVKVEELHKQALSDPFQFSGLHYPMMLRMTGDLVSGALALTKEGLLPNAVSYLTNMRSSP